jgi:hypothetical protein
METAKTILAQLGGSKFALMTGAKNFIAYPSAITFQLPSNFAKNGINKVRIELSPSDLYNLTFSRVRGLKVFYESKLEGIYCDQLRETFTEATGLHVQLPHITIVKR